MATVEQLNAKYQSVIDLAKSRGVHLKNVHLENEKLVIRGTPRTKPSRTRSGTRSRRSTPCTPTSPPTSTSTPA